MLAVGRAIAFLAPGDERLPGLYVGLGEGGKFRDLDQQFAAEMLARVLGTDVLGQAVGEPFAGEDAAGARLQDALVAFEDQHVIGLTPGLEHAGDQGDQEHLTDRRNVFDGGASASAPR